MEYSPRCALCLFYLSCMHKTGVRCECSWLRRCVYSTKNTTVRYEWNAYSWSEYFLYQMCNWVINNVLGVDLYVVNFFISYPFIVSLCILLMYVYMQRVAPTYTAAGIHVYGIIRVYTSPSHASTKGGRWWTTSSALHQLKDVSSGDTFPHMG